jgi:hypothetical protein
MGGTAEEIERCARQLDREVTEMLRGLLALARDGVTRADVNLE